MKKIIIPITLLIVFLLSGFLLIYHYYTTEIVKSGDNSHSVTFIITSGEGIQQISQELLSLQVIDNPTIFNIYLKLNQDDKKIEAGSYLIPARASIVDIAKLLQKGNFFTNITIPEGKRLEEQASIIYDQLKSNNPSIQFSEQDFINEAKNSSFFTQSFISQIPNGKSLEGFLFPDTYQVDKNATAKDIINIMLDAFSTKAYAAYTTGRKQTSLNLYQTVTLASILEREAKTDTDKRMIADILIRRLNTNYPLGVDSTLQYLLGYSTTEKTWWRQTIYETDLNINSPYNTRLNPGLPPTPIANPGLGSITDAMTPISNNYFYYISDNQGNIHYAIDINQQNANIAKYLR